MSMTIEKLNKKIADINNQREENERIITETQTKIDDLMKKADAAAESGNVDEYEKYKSAADKLGTTIYVKRMRNQKLSTEVTKKDAVEAWENYKPKAEKLYREKLEAFTSLRKVFFNSFVDLFQTMNEIYAVRERLYSVGSVAPFKAKTATDNEPTFEDLYMTFPAEKYENVGFQEVNYFGRMKYINTAGISAALNVLSYHAHATDDIIKKL